MSGLISQLRSIPRITAGNPIEDSIDPVAYNAADALEKALEYMRHKPGCAMYHPQDCSTDCDCGLSTLVNAIRGE